jgi:putative NADPH-quinone reductase
MSAERILVIDAHPDPDPKRFVHALADAYLTGANERRQTRLIRLSELDFPLLRSAHDWKEGKPPESIAAAQADIAWAEHIVFLYPLWLGDVPALLKGFLEQALRPGFALRYRGHYPQKLLKGRSARIVVTMGMPAFFYRLVYRAHSLKSLERNILRFVGIGPVAETIIGLVESSATNREDWLKKMEDLGRGGL